MDDRIIAVTGATGLQGGKVARWLLARGWKVRALTRDVDKPAAKSWPPPAPRCYPATWISTPNWMQLQRRLRGLQRAKLLAANRRV